MNDENRIQKTEDRIHKYSTQTDLFTNIIIDKSFIRLRRINLQRHISPCHSEPFAGLKGKLHEVKRRIWPEKIWIFFC